MGIGYSRRLGLRPFASQAPSRPPPGGSNPRRMGGRLRRIRAGCRSWLELQPAGWKCATDFQLETSAKFQGWGRGGTTDDTDGTDENIPPLNLIRVIREIRGQISARSSRGCFSQKAQPVIFRSGQAGSLSPIVPPRRCSESARRNACGDFLCVAAEDFETAKQRLMRGVGVGGRG